MVFVGEGRNMKYLFVGDMHLQNVQISSRRDSVAETSLRKLEWVLNYALSEHIECVVTSGDTLGVPITSKVWLNQLLVLLIKFRDMGVRVVTAIGNHSADSVYKQYQTFRDRDLGTLFYAEALEIYNQKIIEGELFSFLHAYRYNQDGSYLEVGENQATVVVAHYFINEGFPGDDLVILVADLRRLYPNLRTVLMGHDHTYHGSVTVEGVRFVAPGSMMRVSSDVAYKEDRKFAVVSADTVDFITIPSQLYSEVFLVELKDVDKEAESQIEKFKASIAEIKSNVGEIEETIKSFVKALPEVELRESIKSDLQDIGISF